MSRRQGRTGVENRGAAILSRGGKKGEKERGGQSRREKREKIAFRILAAFSRDIFFSGRCFRSLKVDSSFSFLVSVRLSKGGTSCRS